MRDMRPPPRPLPRTPRRPAAHVLRVSLAMAPRRVARRDQGCRVTGDLQCADCGLIGPGVTLETWLEPPRPLCGDHREQAAAALHAGATGSTATDSDTSVAITQTHWLDGAPMDPAAEPPEALEALPGFPFLHRGAAAVIVGPTGGGRSSLVQSCAYDAAAAGFRVAYLGSEVTEGEFNARAGDLARRRADTIDSGLRERLAAVRYLDLASVIAKAWEHPQQWVQEITARFDVVIADPLSAVASTLDLDFDKSNAEYARFHDMIVQPLVSAGLVFLSLDNIGHAIEARSRAKGASAKQDRADVTLWCKPKAQPAGLIITVQKVRSVRAPFRRGDSWTFDRETQRITRDTGDPDTQPPAWRPTVLMQRVSRAIQDAPGISRTAIRSTVQGKSQTIATALDLLIADGYVEHRDNGHYSTRGYVVADDGPTIDVASHSSAVPGGFPGPTESPVPAVPPSHEVTGNGNRNGNVIPFASLEEEHRVARLLAKENG
jgi:hypothetical protein